MDYDPPINGFYDDGLLFCMNHPGDDELEPIEPDDPQISHWTWVIPVVTFLVVAPLIVWNVYLAFKHRQGRNPQSTQQTSPVATTNVTAKP